MLLCDYKNVLHELMTLLPAGSSVAKQRIFNQWLIDRIDRIGYEQIPEYYMDAWKTLDPMQLPFGFIHEWHQYWREHQSNNQQEVLPAELPQGEASNAYGSVTVDITALLAWLEIDALERFKEVVACIVDDNRRALIAINRSIGSVNPIPCCCLPELDHLHSSIAVLTDSNPCKVKRLRTILRLLHHPDQGGNAEMFIRIEESFKSYGQQGEV